MVIMMIYKLKYQTMIKLIKLLLILLINIMILMILNNKYKYN